MLRKVDTLREVDMLKSEEIRAIREELDTACSGLYEEAIGYKNHGDEGKHKMAWMANLHLTNAYLELMNAIDLLELMETME